MAPSSRFNSYGENLTIGTYYPNSNEGFGNNTAFFNIITGPPRLATAPVSGRKPLSAQSQQSRQIQSRQQSAQSKKSHQSHRPTMVYNNANRSSAVGKVVAPGRYEGTPSRPATMKSKTESRPNSQSRPNTQNRWNGRATNHSRLIQSRPNTQNSRPNTHNSRANTRSRPSTVDKIKFSANLQNTTIEEITPINTSPHVEEDRPPSTYEGGAETHRDLGLRSHYPGRYYYPTQFLLN